MQNNLWVDNGQIKLLEYKADTKKYVDGAYDVQIAGSSVMVDGVANIPYASSSNHGVAKTNSSYGIQSNSSGVLSINHATSGHAKGGSDLYRPITPDIQHESVFYGLAKAAGDTSQASSSNAVGTYTEVAKHAIQNMLGVEGKMRLLKKYDASPQDYDNVGFYTDQNGQTFQVDQFRVIAMIPKTSSSAPVSVSIETTAPESYGSKSVCQIVQTNSSADTIAIIDVFRDATTWRARSWYCNNGGYNGAYTGAVSLKGGYTGVALNPASWVRTNNPLYATQIGLRLDTISIPQGTVLEFYGHDYQG